MSVFRLEDTKIRPVALSAAGLFLFFAALFFSPVAIPHKIAFTLGSAFVMSLWLCPWQITMTLLFSALGDYFGSCHNFLAQMGQNKIQHCAKFLLEFTKDANAKRISLGLVERNTDPSFSKNTF